MCFVQQDDQQPISNDISCMNIFLPHASMKENKQITRISNCNQLSIVSLFQ